MSLPEALSLTLTAVGGGSQDISSLVHGLSFGTNAPGGDGDCRLQMNDAGAHTDALFRAGSKLVISDDQGTVYCGRLEVPGGEYVPQFGRITHLFRGYASAADDRIYATTKQWWENYSIQAIFEESLSDLCPDISMGTIQAGGRTLPETSQDFLFASAQQIWNTIAPLGGDSIPLLWRVFCTGSSTTPALFVQARPTAASYTTALAEGTRVNVTGDLRQVYNAVAVKVKSGNNAAGCACVTVHDSNSQSDSVTGIGTMRMMGIDLTAIPGIETIDAIQAANMMLSQVSTLRSVGTEITLDYPQTVSGAGPLWRVRAGNIIKVNDLDTGDFLLGNELYIVSTRWDEPRRRLTIQVGQRNGVAEAIGRSIRHRRPGRADAGASDPIPEIAREPRRGTVYDIGQHPGGTNPNVSYAPGDHSHGTPNGDIAWTYGLDGVGAAIVTPAQTAMGLIQGTVLTWKIRCNPGGLIRYRLTFPTSQLLIPGAEDPIIVPGGVVFAEGSNGSLGDVNLEVLTGTEVDVEVQGVPTATWASLILTGTRNLIFSNPLTPLEGGTGAGGVEPEPVPPS